MSNNHPTPELLSESAIAEIEALSAKVPDGPWFADADVADDVPEHRRSGLALVDTGRGADWWIARLCEWHVANFIAASKTNVDALCQTVRAAWVERDEAIKARDLFVSLKRGQTERADELYARGLELLSANTALRNQLTQADETNRLAGLQIVDLESRLARAQAHIKAQDERILNQRNEIKERVRLQADAERTVQTYRAAFGVEPHCIDGLRRIEEMKSRLAQVEKERASSCWHCGTVLESVPKLHCEDCPAECDITNCDAFGCADKTAEQHLDSWK